MPGNNITIRPATEDDHDAITRLVHDARLNPNGLDWRRFVVADEGGRIVGCADLKIHRHGTRELHLLAVEPARRGAGIGSRFVEALLGEEAGGHARGPGLLWAPRGARYHRSLAGAGRRSRGPAPERDETRHGMTADDDSIEEPVMGEAADSPPAAIAAVAAPKAVTDDAADATETGAAEAEPDDLLGQLSRAMHAAAGSQHRRIAEELERQRAAQVDAIKARTGSEAKGLKKTSQDDIGEIDAWAKTATELIAAERVRRIDARREKLQAELLRQDVIVEREVLAVEAAVEAHQAELDAFFSQLEHESDPVGIARLASSLPSLPSLAETADAARRQATAEFALLEEPAEGTAGGGDTADDAVEVSPSRLMAVMASDASSGSGIDVARPWESAPRAIAVPAGVGAAAAPANESKESEARAGAGSRPLLRAIPSTRPMDRLRGWNRKPDDDPDREG
jgi:GNAT superfamily N-acetyltransferase